MTKLVVRGWVVQWRSASGVWRIQSTPHGDDLANARIKDATDAGDIKAVLPSRRVAREDMARCRLEWAKHTRPGSVPAHRIRRATVTLEIEP